MSSTRWPRSVPGGQLQKWYAAVDVFFGPVAPYKSGRMIADDQQAHGWQRGIARNHCQAAEHIAPEQTLQADIRSAATDIHAIETRFLTCGLLWAAIFVTPPPPQVGPT